MNQERNVDVVPVIVDAVVVSASTGKAIIGQMRASYTAEKQGVLAKEQLWADGVRAEMLESGATQREQVIGFLLDGMPAATSVHWHGTPEKRRNRFAFPKNRKPPGARRNNA